MSLSRVINKLPQNFSKNYNKFVKRYKVPHFINGHFMDSIGIEENYIKNPTNDNVIGSVILDDINACNTAIYNSKEAFNNWSNTSVKYRVDKMVNWYKWIENNKEQIAHMVSEENGKTYQDALAELERGMEVIQFSFSAPVMLKGEYSIINNNLEIYTKNQPLGVTVGIMPFNFPAMIPLWMIPLSLVSGNTIIIKASEKCPSTAIYLAYGATKVGIPNGVLNVINGGKTISKILSTHQDISAVSFVGSTEVGKIIYKQASETGKRTQINMGAKNHAVVMNDCDYEDASNSIISAFVVGQRCMAISVLIIVDGAEKIVDKIIEKIKKIDPVNDTGPLISNESKQNVINSIETSVKKGAKIIYGDYNKKINNGLGNYIEPIIINNVTTEMPVYQKELFAPVLSIIRVANMDEAINIVNQNEYGNGTSIFTTSSFNANKYENAVNITQCGINVPIPVSPPYYSWTSSKESYRGSHYIYGPSSFDFYTQKKTIMNKFTLNSKISSNMPIL